LLIFGTPIPNYVAPANITTPAAACAIVPLKDTLQALHSSGQLKSNRQVAMTPQLASMLEAWKKIGGDADIDALYLTAVIWSRVHGLVMLEIGRHVPPVFTDPGELFRREIENILIQYL
jgi:hypothetical protein